MTRITKILESTLSAGATTVTFTDTDIPNSLIRLYSSDPDLMPVSQTITNNTLTITYEPQSYIKYIAVELVKEGLDVIDDLTSEDDANALSAKQGYILKGLIDNIQSASSLSELDDVLIISPSADNILVYDANDHKWKNSVMPEITTSLTELDDVDITNIQDGQVIAWNATAQKFVNVNQSGGGSEDYTLNETQIGTYLGKPLYRKSFIFTNAVTCSSQTWTRFPEATASNIANIVRSFFEDVNGTLFIPTGTNVDSGTFGVLQTRNANVIAKMFTVEYTKTTD